MITKVNVKVKFQGQNENIEIIDIFCGFWTISTPMWLYCVMLAPTYVITHHWASKCHMTYYNKGQCQGQIPRSE